MEKQLTLDQTWKYCLRMYKWVAEVFKEGDDVTELKRQ
jgi:hypothetical protein